MFQEPFKALSGRRTIPTSYKNATILYAGVACFIFILYAFLDSMRELDHPPLIPGLEAMSYLCFPALYFWGGVILRERFRKPSPWIFLMATGLVIVSVVLYADLSHKIVYNQALYLVMIGTGFLAPPEVINPTQKSKGWFALALALAAVFCFTAIGVIKSRYILIEFTTGQEDLSDLLYWLLIYSRLLLYIVSAYLLAQFAFSEAGQKIGGSVIVKYTAIVSCVLTFMLSVKLVFIAPFAFMAGYEYYSPILYLIVQPVFVFLVIWGIRKINGNKKANQ